MTAYGESVTQKEILIDSYLVAPGFLEDTAPLHISNNVHDWKITSPNSYLLAFKEFHFSHHILSEPAPLQTKFSATEDFVMMQFCLKGSCEYSTIKGNRTITFLGSEHNIVFIPKGQDLRFSYGSLPFEAVNIYFEKSFLSKYIPSDHPFMNKMDSKYLSVIGSNNLSVSPKIQSVIQDIINCGFDGHLKKLYTQAKVIELLTLQLVQFEEDTSESNTLKQSDIDKMMLVKDLITKDFKESFSLSYLSRAAGTNEQYLKKNFKILFGSTVFNYIQACKMEKAKELLLHGEYKIADIAELTGYKHATHFTSAFKKFFGYLPQKIKGKLDGIIISPLILDWHDIIKNVISV
jgi:AraC-like DNA-binding protein